MLLNAIKNRRSRDLLIQIAFLSCITLVAITVIMTARQNLADQGMTTGLSFLGRSTGWNIGFSLIDYDSSSTYARALWVGFLNTIFLSCVAIPLATLLGGAIAILRISSAPILALIGRVYVDFFRNIPLLLQLMFFYAVLKSLPQPKETEAVAGMYFTGRGVFLPWFSAPGWVVVAALAILVAGLALRLALGLSPRFRRREDSEQAFTIWGIALLSLVGALAVIWIFRAPDGLMTFPERAGLRFNGGAVVPPELLACLIAITIYGAAFIAEILRAGLQAVPAGQIEAAKALGLSRRHVFTRVRFPLAIRSVMPTLSNQFIWLTKASTLGIAVGFADLYMVVSVSINQAGQTLELIGILMGGFLLINYSLAFALNRLNDAIRLKGSEVRT